MGETIKKTEEGVFISEADQYLFAQGTHYDIYKKLGAHPTVQEGREGVFFGVWAPNAESVHVIGSFNGWDETANPMKKIGPGGIHTAFVPGVGEGEL
jgi:1,4-alpha-glucan branching enzyme